jgi:hypothetical protein
MSQIAKTLVIVTLSGVLVAPALAQMGHGTAAQTIAVSAIATTPVPVEKIDNPQQLVQAGVLDSTGAPIGKVLSVKTGSDGKARRIMMMLTTPDGMGRVAALRTDGLGFDAAQGVLVTDFSPAQVAQLAATATTMAPASEISRSSGMVARPSGY